MQVLASEATLECELLLTGLIGLLERASFIVVNIFEKVRQVDSGDEEARPRKDRPEKVSLANKTPSKPCKQFNETIVLTKLTRKSRLRRSRLEEPGVLLRLPKASFDSLRCSCLMRVANVEPVAATGFGLSGRC